MKNILTFLAIFISCSILAQDRVLMNNGVPVLIGGNPQITQAKHRNSPYIPPPPPPPPPFVGPEKVTVWAQDFENTSLQNPYTETNVSQDFPWLYSNVEQAGSYISNTNNIAVEYVDGSHVMSNFFPAGNWGVGSEANNDGPTDGTGVNISSTFAQTGGFDELYLKYRIKFSAGFDWGLGGKLPGLYIRPRWGSIDDPTAGTEGAGSVLVHMWQPDGKMKYYLYTQDHLYRWGGVLNFVFEDDTWYEITLRCVNSDPGSYNGFLETFIDGKLDPVDATNIKMREWSNRYLDGLDWHTFQGGGDDSYAPDVDGTMWIDDIELFYLTGTATADHPIGRTLSPVGRDISYYTTGETPEPGPTEYPINMAIIGNSIASGTYDSLELKYPGHFNLTDLAVAGDGINDQLADWQALSSAEKLSFDYVAIAPLGVNDVASGGSYYSQIAERYNTILASINADISSTCKIVMSVMTPALGSTYIDATKNSLLKSLNSNYIMQNPPYVDIAYSTNWDDMAEADYLGAWYDSGDHIHPGWYGEYIMRENLLEAIGYSQINPPVEAWADSITMLRHTDWNDLTAQTSPIYSTITDAIGGLNFVGGESSPHDNIFQTLAITDMGGGNMALESIFPENSCCVEYDNIGIGTAGYWEFWLTDNHDQFPEIWLDYTITFEPGFTINEGMKTPGVTITTFDSPQRLMFIYTGTPGVFQIQWYNDVFADDYDADPERYASTGWGLSGITVDAGGTYRITQRYSATESGTGGSHYLFIDNILVAKRTGARFNSSVTQTSYFDNGNMSLFMGGDNIDYISDHTESHWTDNYSWFTTNWHFGTGGDMPLGYDISGMLDYIDTFHD